MRDPSQPWLVEMLFAERWTAVLDDETDEPQWFTLKDALDYMQMEGVLHSNFAFRLHNPTTGQQVVYA